MEKQQLLDQAKDKLTPLETGNIVNFVQNMSMQSLMDHPLVLLVLAIIGFYAIVRKSKFVLLFLFAAISIMLLIKFTLAPDIVGSELSIRSLLPFVAGGLVIGGALIYFTFIKSE
ncbi:MAG: hypothetical protein HXX17_05560 [Geobacteraceae bacterium]|nr:hypothetical protein [Geobacteraceae bacterium]